MSASGNDAHYRQVELPAHVATVDIVPGEWPVLEWVSVSALVIDDRYQRPLGRSNWATIRRIARHFQWSRFSPLIVCPVSPAPGRWTSRYAIVDGQHRAHAALMAGIDEVPCLVSVSSPTEQAASFATINGSMTRVSALQVFRAAVASQEPWALEIVAVCDAAGCEARTANNSTEYKKPGEVYATKALQDAVKRFGGAVVTGALTALRQSQAGGDAEIWASVYLRVWLVCVGERPWLAGRVDDLAAFLDAVSLYEIIDEATRLSRAMRAEGQAETVYSMAVTLAGSALDKMYPQRMALPETTQIRQAQIGRHV